MATTIIGMVLPDGRVKYIKSEDRETIFEKARILTRFYKTGSRVSALIELGDLYELGPSPYGLYNHDIGDKVHCLAMIRDLRHTMDEFKPQVIDNKDIFLRASHPALLFEEGGWYLVHGGQFLRVNGPRDIPRPKREMDTFGLSIIRLTRHIGRMQKDEINFDFSRWGDMVEKAKADDDTYHVFRHSKPIATINPKPIPNTL